MPFTCDLSIISDCHLGTPHCRAAELHDYLRSVRPRTLVINGDLCDLGAYFTTHWPVLHQAILRRLLELAAGETEVIYVIGNHDAPLQRFADIVPGLRLESEYDCTYHGQRILCTHGHRFDGRLCGLPLVRQLGGFGYEALQWGEYQLGRLLRACGLPEARFVAAIKHGVPGAGRVIRRFEEAALELAFAEQYDIICCGHIHVPRAIERELHGRRITYLNSGDWVEHCTAVEAVDGAFTLHEHRLAPRTATAIHLPEFPTISAGNAA